MSGELTLTRRDFVKVGGALFVGASFPAVFGSSTAEAATTTLDATQLKSWLEIHADGTILARTGRTETGTSVSAFYAQVIADELDVPATSVSVLLGHTDETPDGGYSAGFLSGAANLRKVAAYTRQALLGLASARLGVPVANLKVTNGVVGPEAQAQSGKENEFRYDRQSGEYILDWRTKGLAAGTYRLRIDLGDGASHTVLVTLQ